MADVVDLADSDDDVSAQVKVHEEVDLGDDDPVMVTAAPAQPVGRAGRRKSGGAGGGAGSGAVGRGAASKNSPNRNKRAKRDGGSAASGAGGGGKRGGTVVAVLDVDDDGPDGGSGGSGGSGAKSTCAACEKEARSPFTLERCGHALCPACVMTISTPTPTCPAAACSEFVSVRDLALILTERKWAELQEKRLEAFRARAEKKGSRCPTCKSWVEVPRPLEGTASQRAKRLLSSPALVCLQGHYLCQFCGAALKKQAPPCGCGGARLLAFRGLLSLLEELVAEPASEALCGPVGKLPKAVTAAARGGGGGDGGRGRGRGRGAYAYVGGRGGGGRGGGMWEAVVNGFSGYGGGYGYGGGGGGAEKISSKWSKGTGYGGSGDAAAAAEAQAVAAEAEARSDKAMVVVFDALVACLPKRGDLPDHLLELLALVRESSLLQLVCSYLRNDSLMDIAKRRGLYQVSSSGRTLPVCECRS